MADWSQLPKELLHLIYERLDSALYLLRFRSVCSSWRSSSFSIPNHHHHHHLPFEFPILSNDPTTTNPHNHNNDSAFSLSKRTVFLITPPQQQQQQQQQQQTLLAPLHPWLIKIGEDPHGRTHLRHPLLHFPFHPTPPFPSRFPQLLDLYELPVFDLGQEFVLNEISYFSYNSVHMKKVVFSWLGSKKEGFVLFTIHVSGKLALFRSGDEGWTIIPDMPTPYDDVCVYKGKLCSVDRTGRTVEVGLDSSVSLMADSVFGGDKKFLVECGGELLLVDKYLSSDFDCCFCDFEEVVDDDGEIYEHRCKRAVKFEVYRLEEEERKWVEMANLGDWVLFLGDACAFCASVSDLCVSKGDCVIFRDDTFINIDNELESGMCVFHLGEDRISLLSDYPDYSKLFWPPPNWVKLH